MRNALFTANARPLGSSQTPGTGPLDLAVWTARQSGGGATVLEPSRLGSGGYVVNAGLTSGYATNLFVGRAIGGSGQELRPLNTAYHPRIHV